MLVLPRFSLVAPRTIPEAVQALGERPGTAMPLAGGTDLIPNLKHGLFSPERLVSIRRVDALREVRETADGGLFLGAGLSLAQIAEHPRVRARYPALAHAASLVAGPQHRQMGTLGGNLCLDTRCVYYNQTWFWRNALGYCLKKDGELCHVVPKGTRCVAAYSADTPSPLMTYDATLTLASVRGERTIPVTSFFRAEGTRNTVREPDELVLGVTVPKPRPGLHGAYVKLRVRQAVDFPVLSVAVTAVLGDGRRVEDLSLIVGAVAAQPRVVKGAADAARGRTLDDELVRELGRLAHTQCHFLPSLNVDSAWRRDVLPVYVRRAIAALSPSTGN